MKAALKRLFDLLASGAALLLLAPLLLLLALWVRLDSSGPALFRQRRLGLAGKEFRVLKFRTMVNRRPDDIDQHTERVLRQGDDPRITRAGRWLRATSLDELPQLWNILIGEMSVVGPRPILPEQREVMPPEYHSRFSVRPGLTGLSQVRGRRSLGWLQQLQGDAEYARRHHLLYDLVLILRTVYVVLAGKGVYAGGARNWRSYRQALRHRAGGDRETTGGDRGSTGG